MGFAPSAILAMQILHCVDFGSGSAASLALRCWRGGFQFLSLASGGWLLLKSLMTGVDLYSGQLLPALIHNHSHGGGWTLSTNNERNFFLGNNPFTPNYKTSQLGQRSLAELPVETAAYLKRFYDMPEPRRAMVAEAMRHIASNPGQMLLRCFNRFTSFWGFDYIASRQIQQYFGFGAAGLLALLIMEGGAYLSLMVFVIVGLFSYSSVIRRDHLVFLIGLVLAYSFPYVLAFSGGTYHFPVVGLLIPFAGLAAAAGPLRVLGAIHKSRLLQVALLTFICIQFQYAYFSVLMSQ
jgi:hypothetical protein